MNDKNFQTSHEARDGKSKTKIFWKHIGYVAIAVILAVVTVIVLNFNR